MQDFFLFFSPSGNKKLDTNKVITYLKDIYSDPLIVENSNGNFHAIAAGNPLLQNHKPFYSTKLNKYFWVYGNLFLPNNFHSGISGKYESAFPSHEILLEFAESKGIESFKDFHGWFNIISYSELNNEIEIINSRLGLLPLYYCMKDESVILSSRLGIFYKLLNSVEIDKGAILQQCLYNYTFSNNTHIKGVYSLPASVRCQIKQSKIKIDHYWSLNQELISAPLDFNESKKLLDETLDSVISRIISINNDIAISLTGGWDCRLILAYALKHKSKNDILLYSFGAEGSPDIKVPSEIARKHKLNYLPIILDEDYLKNKFNFYSEKTIQYSDSSRSFKRCHYLYAMDLIKEKTNFLISGIGGSNLLKSSAYAPNNVFNRFVLDLIRRNDFENVLMRQYDFIKSTYNVLSSEISCSDFLSSFEYDDLRKLHEIKNADERFCTYLVGNIERKYFGAEISTYRHLLFSYSPFFDYEFMHGLFKTSFFGGYSKLKLFPSLQNALLYSELINKNSDFLGKEITDRNIPLYGLNTPIKYLNSLIKYFSTKLIENRKYSDLYNTSSTFEMFLSHINCNQKMIAEIGTHRNDFISNYISIMWFIEKNLGVR